MSEVKKVEGLKVVVDNLPEEVKRNAEKISITEESLRLMKTEGISLTSMLSRLDPSQPGDSMDAFEKELCRRGIKIAGPDVDMVQRFFQTTNDDYLFPEFLARQVIVGQQKFNDLANIVAVRQKIDGKKYETIFVDDDIAGNTEKDRQLIRTPEYGSFPGVKIKTAKQSVELFKYGRYVEASYEAIRRQKVDVIAIFFQAMGMQIQKDKFAAAMKVLINGDGNNNAATVIDWASTGIAYEDILRLKLTMENEGYNLNFMIAPLETAISVYKLTEFSNALVPGLDAMKTGVMPKPLGVQLISDLSGEVAVNSIVGIDKSMAVQELYETELMTETETMIREQFKGTAISEVCGYAKLMPKATKVLKKA